MLRYLIAAAGLVLALSGAARAEDNCDGPPLTPAQWAALPDHDRIDAFQHLVQCAEQGIAVAEEHVRNLSSAKIAESADTWLGERNHFADLVQSYASQLAAAKQEIIALTDGRTALEAEIKSLNDALTKAASDRDAYLAALTAANGQIGALAAERDRLRNALDNANRQLAAKQDELDAANKRLADLDQRVDSLTIVLDQTNVKMTSLQASLDSANAKISELNQTIEALNASLKETSDRMATLQAALDTANGTIGTLTGKVDDLTAAMADSAKKIADLNDGIMQLKAALDDANAKAAALTAALADANTRNDALTKALADANQKIAELTNALCVAGEKIDALSNKLEPYSEDFAVGLKALFDGDANVMIDGNRVIVATEVLFPSGSADLNKEGIETVKKVAAFLKQYAPKFPAGLKWSLQVNGHTDIRPIRTRQFPSNWELSTARAISVVKVLQTEHIDGQHLAATGFGEFQPLATGNDPEVLRHNRRIEMEITSNGMAGAEAAPAPPSACGTP
jgi:chemotaxis protein MotB